jgi:hypothetical protein
MGVCVVEGREVDISLEGGTLPMASLGEMGMFLSLSTTALL